MRDSRRLARRVAVAVAAVLAAWLGAAVPAAAQCEDVPDCQVQQEGHFVLGGWATKDHAYTCRGEYPYVWNFTYHQTGAPSVSAIGGIAEVRPGTIGILFTNWNPFQTDTVSVAIACSKRNSFGGNCGGPVWDPHCPVVAGSQKTYCSRGPVPVCFETYEERCHPSNQLYSCTIAAGIAWCAPCPG